MVRCGDGTEQNIGPLSVTIQNINKLEHMRSLKNNKQKKTPNAKYYYLDQLVTIIPIINKIYKKG